jgi:hypothetical protein
MHYYVIRRRYLSRQSVYFPRLPFGNWELDLGRAKWFTTEAAARQAAQPLYGDIGNTIICEIDDAGNELPIDSLP